jgi:hypothetical protein
MADAYFVSGTGALGLLSLALAAAPFILQRF